MARGLSPGILNVVTVYESSDPGVYISSATPVPILPKVAAEEMCDIFKKTIDQETKSDLLLSRDRALSEIQKSAVREAIWHDHIRSFGVDLDYLLNDVDEGNESDDDDDSSYEAMCERSLMVFRNLFEFLKKSRAHHTIQYLIQACKEHGVISFYSQYQSEEGTLRNDSEIALYECAPKCTSDLVPPNNDADSNENNDDMTEFYRNFGFRTGFSSSSSICPNNNCPSSFVENVDKSSLIEEETASLSSSSMEQLCSFNSFDAFSRAGSFRDRIQTDEPPGGLNNNATKIPPPQSPSSREQHEEGGLRFSASVCVSPD